MIFSNLTASVRSAVAASAVLLAVLGTTPAFANSSATADIAAPLRAAQEARQSALGNGDAEFRRLFANWQSLDKPQGFVAPSVATTSGGLVSVGSMPMRRISTSVSIPSRMPVDGVHLTSGFGMRVHPVLGVRRGHKGVDLAAPTGTPIRATADATVSKAEWFSSYGLYVSLEHGADIQTRYGHMSRLNVYSGQQVRKGDIIGYVGSTGRSTGPHLHYEVRIAGVAVNPGPYMQADQFKKADGGMGGPE